MFEEGLVITLLLAIFFVVFYIIYNNSCGCNKSLIENFEDDKEKKKLQSAFNDYAFYSKDLNIKIKKIDDKLMELSKRLDNIENRSDNNTGNSIDNDLLKKINETIEDVKYLKDL